MYKLALLGLIACHSTIPPATGTNMGPATTSPVIDCTKLDQTKLVAAQATAKSNIPDWPQVLSSLPTDKVLAGCALALAIEDYMTQPVPPSLTENKAASDTLNDFRAANGSATYLTSEGNL